MIGMFKHLATVQRQGAVPDGSGGVDILFTDVATIRCGFSFGGSAGRTPDGGRELAEADVTVFYDGKTDVRIGDQIKFEEGGVTRIFEVVAHAPRGGSFNRVVSLFCAERQDAHALDKVK